VPLWFTLGVSYALKLLQDSAVVCVVCGERWTGALLTMVHEGKLPALRIIVQREHLRYEELVLKETLEQAAPPPPPPPPPPRPVA